MEDREPESITDTLRADHQHLEDLFAGMQDAVARGDFAGAQQLAQRFDAGLRRHNEFEEREVFPRFDAHAGIVGPVAVMRAEHRRFEELLGECGRVLVACDAAGFAAVAESLRVLLQSHHLKEVRIVYPRTDGILDREERRRVAALFRIG
jgi:iron-sulfur cluster repair protein YtfE (RIC family)